LCAASVKILIFGNLKDKFILTFTIPGWPWPLTTAGTSAATLGGVPGTRSFWDEMVIARMHAVVRRPPRP